MRRSIFIILAVLSACNSLKKADKTSIKQAEVKIIPLKQFNGDTLQYVKTNFINNKSKYIDKELKVLINDLGVPVKSYLLAPSSIANVFTSISLSFESPGMLSYKIEKSKALIINVNFAKTIPIDSNVVKILRKDQKNWTSDEYKFYGSSKIKDIVLTDWDHH